MKHKYILGVSMSNHDRSACLLKDGEIFMAISEERLDRRKKSEGFYGSNANNIVLPPLASITYLLREAKISINDLDIVVCGRSIANCKEDFLKYFPIEESKVYEIPIPGHHLAHAYSAAATSVFENSIVLVIDEQGHSLSDNKYEKYSIYSYNNSEMNELQKVYGDHQNISLGMFYDIFAALVGLSEAGMPSPGKLMGLAPFGKKRIEWAELIEFKNDQVNICLHKIDDFFSNILPQNLGMENINVGNIDELLVKYIPIHWDSELAYDLAYKAQEELEKALFHISSYCLKKSISKNLCYAGGVALNCTANSKLLEKGWDDIYVHPAATDDGIAMGLAYYGLLNIQKKAIAYKKKFNPFTGKSYSANQIESSLKNFEVYRYAENIDPVQETAKLLRDNKIVCWFQGKSEWGPRALGSRSILANPTMKNVTKIINNNIKHREKFRPFGISATKRGIKELLDVQGVAPSLQSYMLSVGYPVNDLLNEIKHIDNSVRFQMVDDQFQPLYHNMIEHFGEITRVYAVLNTSFNVMGEPLVESPEDAIRQFFNSNTDALVIGDFVIRRESIPNEEYCKIFNGNKFSANIDILSDVEKQEYYNNGYLPESTIHYLKSNYENIMMRGVKSILRYHRIMLNYLKQKGDIETATYHAEEILKLSGFPKEATQALDFLSDIPLSHKSNAYKLLYNFSTLDKGYKFIEGLLKS